MYESYAQRNSVLDNYIQKESWKDVPDCHLKDKNLGKNDYFPNAQITNVWCLHSPKSITRPPGMLC